VGRCRDTPSVKRLAELGSYFATTWPPSGDCKAPMDGRFADDCII
jgi:hypothetical protein